MIAIAVRPECGRGTAYVQFHGRHSSATARTVRDLQGMALPHSESGSRVEAP